MNYDYDRKLPSRGTARRPPPVAQQPPAPAVPVSAVSPAPASAQPPNVQVAFLAGLVDRAVVVESLNGAAERRGVLKKFDMFTLVLEVDGGREVLCFKHGVGAVTAAP